MTLSSLTPDSWPLAAKISDFGLAKLLDADRGDVQSRVSLGTPSYMAPEQAAARAQEVGPATDVYALGAILYELLTGRPPFRGETPLETALQVASLEPVPPRRLNDKVPRDLETICLKCLRKEPRRRYASALDLADDLQRFLAGEPIRARPATAWERALKWIRRRPAAAALIGVCALGALSLMAGGLAYAEHERRRADEEGTLKRAAEIHAAQALENAQTAERNAETIRRYGYLWGVNSIQLAVERAYVSRAIGLLEGQLPPEGRHDLRRFEWHHFWHVCHSARHTLSGHERQVLCLAYSPDGRTLASGSVEETVRLWDAVTGQLRRTLGGFKQPVVSLAFSPDGRTLAAVGSNGGVWLCDVTEDKPQLVTALTNRPMCVTFFPAGKVMALGGRDGTVRVWDLETNREWVLLPSEKPLKEEVVRSVAVAPDGRTLAAGHVSNRVRLWDVSRVKERVLEEDGGPVYTVAFAPDGRTLAAAGDDRTVKLWDTASNPGRLVLRKHSGEVSSVAFAPDGKTLATASGVPDENQRSYLAGEVGLWDPATGQERAPIKRDPPRFVSAVAFAPDGKAVAAGTSRQVGPRVQGEIWLWGVAPDREPLVLRGQKPLSLIKCVAYSRDGRTLASGTVDGQVVLWDPATGQELARLAKLQRAVHCLAFSPDGLVLAAGHANGDVSLWDVATPHRLEKLVVLSGHRKVVDGLAFSPDGQTLAATSSANDDNAGEIKLWDVSGRKERATLRGHRDRVWSVAFTADGRTMATGSDDRTVKLWDPETAEERITFPSHAAPVRSVAFDLAGRRLAAGCSDGTVIIWEAGSPKGDKVTR